MISMGIAAPRLDTLATKPYLASRLSPRCYLALHIAEHGVDQYLSTENCRVKWHKSRSVYIQTLSLITCLVSYIDLQQHISRLALAGSGISLASQSYHTAVFYARRNVYSELGTSSPSIIERQSLVATIYCIIKIYRDTCLHISAPRIEASLTESAKSTSL